MATRLHEILDALAVSIEALTPGSEPSLTFERNDSMFLPAEEQANFRDRSFSFVPSGQNQAGFGWFGDVRRESASVSLVIAYQGLTDGTVVGQMARASQDVEQVRRLLELPATAQDAGAQVIVCEGTSETIDTVSLTLRVDYLNDTNGVSAMANNGRLIDLPLPTRRPRDETFPLFGTQSTSFTNFSATGTTTLIAATPLIGSPRPNQYDNGTLTVSVDLSIASTTGSSGDTGNVLMRVRFIRSRGATENTNNVSVLIPLTNPVSGNASGSATFTSTLSYQSGDAVSVEILRIGSDASDTYPNTIRVKGASLRVYDATVTVPAPLMLSGDVALANVRMPLGLESGSLRVGARVCGTTAPPGNSTVVLTLEVRRARVGSAFPSVADWSDTKTFTITNAAPTTVQETGWYYPSGVLQGDNVELRLVRSGGTYTEPMRLLGWQAYTTSGGDLI